MSAKTYQKSSKTDRVNAYPYAPLFFKKRSRRSKMKLYTAVFFLKVDRYKQCRLADENGSYSNHQRHFSQDAVPSSTSVAWTLSRLTTAFKDIPS